MAQLVASGRFVLKKHLAIIDPEDMIDKLKFIDLKRGDAIVLDEFGVGMDHRRWQSFFNRAMNYIMMTHGFKGIAVFVTVPYRDYVDSDVLKLFDMQIETKQKNEKERWVMIEPKLISYNQTLKKTYYKYPRTVDRRKGMVYIVDKIKVSYPNVETMKEYFAMGNTKKDFMGKSLQREAQRIKRKEFVLEEYVPKVLKDIDKFATIRGSRKYVSMALIENAFDLPANRSKQIKAEIEKHHREVVQNAKV